VQFRAFVPFTALIFICFSLSNTTIRVSAQEEPALNGMVTENGCNTIGGKMRELTSSNGTITVCEYRDIVLKIEPMEGLACPAVVGWWIDPETGEYFEFGYACNVPKLSVDAYCSVPLSIEGTPSGSYQAHFSENLKIDGVRYDIYVNAKSIACYSVNLRKDTKELFLVMATNSRDSNRSMNITFPSELLQGEYKVLIDGNPATFSITKNNSNITLSNIAFRASSERQNMVESFKVQIIGTNVIPEFPTMMVLAASSAVMAIIAVLHRTRFF